MARIYTRSGDDGTTGLGDGRRVPKHSLRVAAYGTVDETSSAIGMALADGLGSRAEAMLLDVQNDLFDVGADLAVPPPEEPGAEDTGLRLDASYVQRLEAWIDELSASLTPLTNFVLPGGRPGAATLHHARCVCRRAERLVNELASGEDARVSPFALPYLNRLSDLLFVLARHANDDGRGDVLWRPGRGSGAT